MLAGTSLCNLSVTLGTQSSRPAYVSCTLLDDACWTANTTPAASLAQTYVQLPYDPTPGFDESAQVMAAATTIIAPLPPADQELLLLLSAMLRHIVRASSRGCEASIAQICRCGCKRTMAGLAHSDCAVTLQAGCLAASGTARKSHINCKDPEYCGQRTGRS